LLLLRETPGESDVSTPWLTQYVRQLALIDLEDDDKIRAGRNYIKLKPTESICPQRLLC